MQLPGERSILQRTYAEDIFDNLRNEHGIVGFYIVLAWDASLQRRSGSQLLLHDLEQNMGKLQLCFLFLLLRLNPVCVTSCSGVVLDIVSKSYTLSFERELTSFPSDDCPHALEHAPPMLHFVDSLMLHLSQKYANLLPLCMFVTFCTCACPCVVL